MTKLRIENFINEDVYDQNNTLITCPITLYDSTLVKKGFDDEVKTLIVEYTNPILKNVVFQESAFLELIARRYSPDLKEIRGILGGIIRHHFESINEPMNVSLDFVNSTYKEYDYPKNFRQKSFYFLKFLYENGGNEFRTFTLSNENDYPLAYSNDQEEFRRIIFMLKSNGYIKLNTGEFFQQFIFSDINVSLDKKAYKQIESGLPKLPFFHLIDEKIFTGDQRIDKRIKHAKELFLKSNTIEYKRSACKELADVLELIKSDMESIFYKKDVNLFFQLVNEFDIRHNNKKTKEIKYEEQIDWMFYNFLNSIITYYKLKNKIK